MSTFNIKQSFILYKHLAIFTRLCLFVNTHYVYSTQLRGSFYSRMLRQISHLLRAIAKIIQDRSLLPPLEICEFRFDVNNEQHDFQVSYIIATKRIFWLCTKIFSNTRYSFKIMNLCVHYFIFLIWRVRKDETNFNFIF